MTAYNPIEAMNRLKAAGLPAKQAEALANEMHGVIVELVTNEQLQAALNKQALYIIGILGTVIVGAATVLGVILSH
jgi:hypothetical protein